MRGTPCAKTTRPAVHQNPRLDLNSVRSLTVIVRGSITAITVLLGFSLSFLRFWGFEAPGEWMLRSVISTGTTLAAIVLQLISLFRSLRLEDRDPIEYQRTVRWFIGSAITLLLGLIFSIVELALLDQK